ncbi:hypothetical protein AYI69_g916 [Smittium culicis]|uniref:Uncharacterized protein n=1 Tax=Smittium culicis TaxID=133412 RepID=A0A1R1YRR1_9FUNG|nr:hypothetical protein AYI69_g916 [Smittium culicis]
MLDQEFFPDLTQCIIKYEGRLSKLLGKAILEDTFEIVKRIPTNHDESLIRNFGDSVPLISSVIKLDKYLSEFCVELKYILRDTMRKKARCNSSSSLFLPQRLEVFGRTVSDIHNLENRLDGFPGTLQEVFCQRTAPQFVKSTFNFSFASYSALGEIDDKMAPSGKIKDLVKDFNELSKAFEDYKLPKKVILSKIIDHVFYIMLEGWI